MAIKAVLALGFLAIALTAVKPIDLGDFWWHLATGRYIVENRALPEADPFTFTATELTAQKTTVLRAYWLAQSCMYLLVDTFGFASMLALRVALLTFISVLLYMMIRKRGLNRPFSLLLVLGIAAAMREYNFLRPALLSFALTLLVFAALERLRTVPGAYRDYRLLAGLPVTMAIWSNMHGAYIVGAAMIGLYLAYELMLSIRRRSFDRRFTVLAALSLVALLASGLNPAGFDYLNPGLIISEHLMPAPLKPGSFITEYYSPLRYLRELGRPVYFYSLTAYTALMAFSFALNRRGTNLFHLALAVIFAAAAWKAQRYGAYLFIFSVFLTGYNLSALELPRREDIRLYALPALAALLLLLMLEAGSFRVFRSSVIPTSAASFIRESGAPANLFAPYFWGGFLDWELYPNYRTFIDGRALSEQAFLDHGTIIRWAGQSDALLNKYGINTVLLFNLTTSSQIIPPALFALLNDSGWEPAYTDHLSTVFIRRGAMAGIRPISRDRVWQQLIGLCRARVYRFPEMAISHAQLGVTYYYMGMMAEARQSFLRALSIDPEEQDSRLFLQAIEARGF